MDDAFIDEFLASLDLSENVKQTVKNNLRESLIYNLTTYLFTVMSEEKKSSFLKLFQEGRTDPDSINNWIAQNKLLEDKLLRDGMTDVVSKALKNFFKSLTSDLTNQKRDRLNKLVLKYTN